MKELLKNLQEETRAATLLWFLPLNNGIHKKPDSEEVKKF